MPYEGLKSVRLLPHRQHQLALLSFACNKQHPPVVVHRTKTSVHKAPLLLTGRPAFEGTIAHHF